MEMDEKLRWLEVRINSSLRPRNEDSKNMLLNEENRLALHEFINNEDVRRLFVYVRPPREIIAGLSPPLHVAAKSVFFLKNNVGVKLAKDNMDEEVMYLDCADLPVEQLDLLVREVYLPLMCTEQQQAVAQGISADKLLDILHRLMAALEVGKGHLEGEILLPLPSIEVLAEAAANANRRGAVLHVLETTVINWIKQIKGLLKHDPVGDLQRQAGMFPGPLDEVQLWMTRLSRLSSITQQLKSPVAADILRNLDDANSAYAPAFQNVQKDISKAVQETEETLRYLGTMKPWFEDLHDCMEPQAMLRLFAPLIHNLLLVWSHSKYFHQVDKFNNLLRLISNEVVHRAEAMVGEDVLREPLELYYSSLPREGCGALRGMEIVYRFSTGRRFLHHWRRNVMHYLAEQSSYSKLKEALRVCAAFRGTYLDYRDKAEAINEQNQRDHAEKMIQRPQGPFTLFSTKMYGANVYHPRYGLKAGSVEDAEEALREEELWRESPWPPRNAPAFDLLNSFMERCNDVLELVQTTRHFRLLSDAAEVGGAGSASLDALVKEIHQQYTVAMTNFFAQVSNVLSIDGTQAFEKAFFSFRTVVKDLERRLAGVLRQSFRQCPTIGAKLRLLEVFEGISSRELVQAHLRDKDQALVHSFTDELVKVRSMFHACQKKPPSHKNMPPFISRLLWIHALKERVRGPMEKLRRVNPHLLEGDLGWQLREAYSEAFTDFEKYETRTVTDWKHNVMSELTERLKQPLLVAEEYDDDSDLRPQTLIVNLDPLLLLLLREIHYVQQEPFNLELPSQGRELLRNTNSHELRVTATRLETIVSKYNTVMKTITEFELPLFERKLAAIDHLFEQGLNQLTWKTDEKADFIETATALVCVDLHRNLDIVQTNCNEIAQITLSWSKEVLDVFTSRETDTSYLIQDLITIQKSLSEEFEEIVGPSGNRIHALVNNSFEVVQMSSASPAWQDYMDYIDAIVLDGLKQACLGSLKAMLNLIVKANIAEDDTVPILRIRLELIENQVAFRPPLDESTSNTSIRETVQDWLSAFLARGRLVDMLGGKGSYADYIVVDEEVQQLLEQIQKLVQDNSEECKTICELFEDYSFLWQLDVNQTFEDFLRGKVSPNPMRNSSKVSTLAPSNLRMLASAKSNSRASSAKSSIESAGIVGTAEKSFLQPKQAQESETNVPSLDEFDSEIEIFKTACDEIVMLQDHQDVGWLRVDVTPIKQVLTTYAAKWTWTFTKYLTDQVSDMLEKLDKFLKRIEPEIEGITGEERDTASFMKMMRLFNEVSSQQSEMDGKFAAMHRTVLLVRKYGQHLPEHTQLLFDAAPARWSSLKTKVSLAKQRLGPRIQEESESITKDLAKFGERVILLHEELGKSEVYSRDCSLGDSWVIIDGFERHLEVLENEAQDLIELQDLLETSVVNFSVLPQCRHDLTNLKEVWETVRIIDEQQSEWKRHRWQKMNTKFLRDETNQQLEVVKNLPQDVLAWDVYMGLHESITNIQDCLPLIDDLSNPAMRTRHWKQLVRVTGGAIQIDNDTLKRMTLGELLSLGLQKHVDDVRAIVQRAGKDLSIEQSLKTYEEVWLSKIFELREHVRKQTAPTSTNGGADVDNQSEMSGEMPVANPNRGQMQRTPSRISNQSSLGRARRTSACSLPASLVNLGEDSGMITLLTTTEPIFDELENHQVSLQAMQSSSAAGSFLDEVMKWQKRLQTVEAVLTTWLEVQEKWIELEEVYTSQDIRMALAHDANIFSAVNRDFRLLMRATEKNPNVLQCCQRKNILIILEKMNYDLEHCRKSLLLHLERRRQIFPRFYFLSMEDVLHIVCNGYDVGQVNLYIGKLFENVGKLQFEELDESERGNFMITGVHSTLGETLPFRSPVLCEGQVESWLTALLAAMKAALQYQLATATGVENPRPREIHSAGARRVSMPERKASQPRAGKEKPGSRSNSRHGSRQSPHRSASAMRAEKAADVPQQQQESGPRSWVLDHVAEIVYLVTQIQMTQQIKQALDEADGGKTDALQGAMDKVNASLNAAVLMLKGLEDKRDSSESSAQSQAEGKQSVSETASQNGAQKGTSKYGSVLDLENRAPIPEEGTSSQPDLETTPASAMADTMTLLNMPVGVNKQEEAEPKEMIDSRDLSLMLFPGQIHKISTLIALLCHQRELLKRLQEQHQTDGSGILLSSSFLWCSQLQYEFDNETRLVHVKCLGLDFEYGFEYIGSAGREVITPLTERVFLTLAQAVHSHHGGLCMGPAGMGSLSSTQELGRALGRPLYTFNCTKRLDNLALLDIFKGFAATGSWICLNNINKMLPGVLSICAQLITAVFEAMRAGKGSAHLLTEEVQLTPGGACFAVISSGIKVKTNNPDNLLLYNSAVSRLPADLLTQFRTVSMLKHDLGLLMEVLLTSQGFQRAQDLAHKTVLLFDLCSSLSATNVPLTNDVSHLSYDSLAPSGGWSQQVLKCVAFEAGAIFDNILSSEIKNEEILRAMSAVEVEEDMHRTEPTPNDRHVNKVGTEQDEEESMVLALRNTFMPRLLEREASVFTTLVHDLWPDVDIPMLFSGGRQTPESEVPRSKCGSDSRLSKAGSRMRSVQDVHRMSYRDSLNLNTPMVPIASGLAERFLPSSEQGKQVIVDINDAIAIATGSLGLIPGTAFQARVSQLAHLNTSHKTVIVVGPPGCGKSETIKTYALAERERGKHIVIQSIFTKSLESEELLGYMDTRTKEWRDGLVPCILRKLCTPQPTYNQNSQGKPVMKVLLLDGEMDENQFELMETILHNNGNVVLGNNERIMMLDSLRFFWEMESLAKITPAILANVGVLIMTQNDVGWRMQLAMWLERRREHDRELLKGLCEQYVEEVVQYVGDATMPPVVGPQQKGKVTHYRKVIWQSNEACINTFTSLLEALINPYPDLSDVEVERYFNYALIWSFGGTLEIQARDHFSTWWRKTFDCHVDYPEAGTVFDYFVDNESHAFVRSVDMVPGYTGSPHCGISHDAFVHTVSAEQLLHLVGVLTDVGKPVMLVGESGSGKSSIINERIRTVCSGEVAEVLGLTINTNRFTNARLLYQRMDERLEWKHGRTYVPKGNKRLLCLIDDINLAQVDKHFCQTATELLRQHMDDGGFYDPDTKAWRYIKNVTYVTTINPQPTANVPKLNPRLLRHFAIFGCPYPSPTELQTIYGTLLHTHFITPEMTSAMTSVGGGMAHHLGIMDETAQQARKVRNVIKEEEEALKELLTIMVKVTLELQDRLRTMFLPTADRCHYVFTMRDLGNVFRNLCLSLRPSCNKESLLLLWEHECDWVYGRRMVNEIDLTRYHQAFVMAVRKEFTNEEQIQIVIDKEKPVFSNLVEQDSGLVTAGNILNNVNSHMSEEDSKTDLYRPQHNVGTLRRLVEHGVEEYNKTHPRIKLALYKLVLEQVCRLARVIASSHEVGHCALVAEGCPGRVTVVANLAANLCGFSVFKINPSPASNSSDYTIDTFKADLVAAYTRAGVKGERLLFLLEEEELLEEDFLVYLTEFIVSGSISHLFTLEEMTTIINSIRTEVTQAGLTYTRDVAWDFFLNTVRKNFRVCLITSGGGTRFQRRCREYPAFVKNVNFMWFPHWTKKQLIKHAAFHLKGIKWLNKVGRENIAHLLAMMHIVLRQQDGQEMGSGQYKHITNTTYEKFVERYISMAMARYTEISETHSTMEIMNQQVQLENKLATRLRKQLDHERVVLQERMAGTVRILSQIGQDTAITEQQIKIVKAQLEKITRLKKLLPEYQVAHERAVYKAIAIVADTKKIVQNMNIESLAELRAMQKPTIDIEDLMAAVIMILKTPQADLTWQKGAKRQMANLERFIEELMSFDDNVLPENTLVLVEPYLRKPSFDPDIIEKKTNNSACGALCRWVRGVCRYNRMMISKVKPLHKKVEETTQAIDGAEHKMAVLDNKRKALEVRLAGLAKSFEEATIDKNDQDEKTEKMDKTLETAARLRKILRQEQSRIQQVLNSRPHREVAITGGIAMATAFASYLGPYHYNFRRLMLTVHWPNCLRERGIPLVIDSIDSIRGRVVDWSVEALKTASGASGTEINDNYLDEDDEDEGGQDEADGEQMEMEADSVGDAAALGAESEAEKDDTKPESDTKDKDAALTDEEEDAEEDYEEGHSQEDGGSEDTMVTSMPIITSEQYNRYLVSLIKLTVGEKILLEWIKKDFGPRQLENAAILYSSWQRPPMLIDPYGEGQSYLTWLNGSMNHKRLVQVNMESRSDPHVIMAIEKSIMKGQPVLLSYLENLDTMVAPIIHHRNTAHENDVNEEPRMIKYCSRRILCHRDFRLYLATPSPKPTLSSKIASSTTLINYTTSNETLVDDLLIRAFARVRPGLYRDRRLALKTMFIYKQVLLEILEYSSQRIQSSSKRPKREMLAENDVDMISDLTLKKQQMMEEIQVTQSTLEELESLRDELFPLARRGTMLYAILRSLASLRREYQFTLPFFMRLFDEAIGGEFPSEFMEDSDNEDFDDESSDGQQDRAVGGATSPMSQHSMADSTARSGGGGTSGPGEPGESSDAPPGGSTGTADAHMNAGAPAPPVGNAEPENHEDYASIISLPDVPSLPTEGVEYTNLPDNHIKQLVDRLTSLVFHRVQQSLFEEDRQLFATLLCLNIQEESGEHFSEEEISLLLQGVPGVDLRLTLKDFECEEPPPSWLPSDKWEDILALSVMPGPVDGLCVHMATHTEEWKAWYRTASPENEPIPLQDAGGEEGEKKSGVESPPGSPDLGPLSDFHQLLLLRMLRPDRLPVAMKRYVDKNLSLNVTEDCGLTLEGVLRTLDAGHLGVLVLLPARCVDGEAYSVSSMMAVDPPTASIQRLAQTIGVSVDKVTMGEGREVAAHEAIEAAERNNSWILIENLHLGTPKFFRDLRLQLQRLQKARGDEGMGGDERFCVWLTLTPSDLVPLELLQSLYTICWDTLERLEAPSSGSPGTQSMEGTEHGSFMNLLNRSIGAALKSVPRVYWQKVRDQSLRVKQALYGAGVVQGLLMARQMLGTRGMSQYYPLDSSQLTQAIDIIVSPHFTAVTANGEAVCEKICRALCEAVYGRLMCNVWDLRYVEGLVRHVLPSIIDNQNETAVVGTMNIPTPPANVDPADYGLWFEDKMEGEIPTLKGLDLFSNVERNVNSALAYNFLASLEALYEAQNMDLGDIQAVRTKPVDILRLRTILDSVLEELPPLLDLGHVPESVLQQDYNFPYHRPSVVSVASAESVLMPESIGFVLLQECLWLNALLCHVRQNVYDVLQTLLAGPEAFPYNLRDIIASLDAEHVPAAWVHPNAQPSTHSLASWKTHLKKRYAQMHVWIKQQMVPVFHSANATPVSHGALRSLWLGGLVNPGALFTALRQEKAVLSNCLVDEVFLAASVCQPLDEDSYNISDEGGVYIHDLYIQGATWDLKRNFLREMNLTSDLNKLPSVYVHPCVQSDLEAQRHEGETQHMYECPVFMNRARQVCAFTLPLNSEGPADKWLRSGTAIILDPGIPDDAPRRSKLHAPKVATVSPRAPGTATTTPAPSSAQGSKRTDEVRSEGGRSKQSQMSYKPMTPRASPLPPELSMVRERHVSTEGSQKIPSAAGRSLRSEIERRTSVESAGKVSRQSQASHSSQRSQGKVSVRSQGAASGTSKVTERSGGQRSAESRPEVGSVKGGQGTGSQGGSSKPSSKNSTPRSRQGQTPATTSPRSRAGME